MEILNREQIQKFIPHRPPILMLDRVLEFEHNKRVVAIKELSEDDPVFVGHFPGNPVMPGALIIEAMAQTAMLLDKSVDMDKINSASKYYLGSVKSHFIGSVFPKDELKLVAEMVKDLPAGSYVKAKAFVGNKEIAQAEFVFMVNK